ncbi:MAG: pyruvate kinase [Atopobiaceae bacterium]|nr:pyruvate kinase [Atopobiaceae bacterium]
MHTDQKTKIVCTMGPATEDDEVLRAMMLAGMNVARLNFSHGSHEYHRSNIERVRRISKEEHLCVAIMVDTKGPEIRTGMTAGHEKVMLETGASVVVTTDEVEGTAERFCLDYARLPQEVEPGSIIFIDDGLIGLEVEHVEGSDIHCRVTNGGALGERKGVNVPNVAVGLPSVTEQDKRDIRFACEMQVDAIAASFIRSAEAVDEIRDLCHEYGAHEMVIIPKIESSIAVANFDEILAVSDGIMVARGDLGVEIPPAVVPHVQKQIIKKCNNNYKFVITATQMLDSMVHNPRPTRAEANDVANAIYDGTDCVMLSGETAAGAYPLESVKMMAEICRQTERHLPERHEYPDRGGVRNVNGAIGFAAVETAERLGAAAILCPTHSGRSARLMSVFRPQLPIFATSPSWDTIRRTNFYWGVWGIKTTEQGGLVNTCYNALTVARDEGFVNTGDIVIITAGDPQTSPRQGDYTTSNNMCMVAQVQ